MRIVDPAQTIVLPGPLVQHSPELWTAIERAGGIGLSQDARDQIASAVLTYVVAGEAVRRAPETSKVRGLLNALIDAADGSVDSGPLQEAIEAINGDGAAPLAARILLSEAGRADLGQLLLQIYAGRKLPPDLLQEVRAEATAALDLVYHESRGHTHGPKSLAGPPSELLSAVIPLYKAAGGKTSYYDAYEFDDLPEATPLVRFVAMICEQFIPLDWPFRRQLVLTELAWSKRVSRNLASNNNRAKPL